MVDNNSTENNVDLVRRDYPEVNIIANDQNLGYGKANNQGFQVAHGKYIAIINPDILIISNIFANLVIRESKRIKDALIGVQHLDLDHQYLRSHFNFPSLGRRLLILSDLKKMIKKINKIIFSRHIGQGLKYVDYVSGAFMFMPKRLFKKSHGFDENYFMYHEELDFCYRLYIKGYPVLLDIDNVIIKGDSNIEHPGNEFVFIERNKSILYFYKKHYSRLNLKLLIILNLFIYFLRWLCSVNKQHRILYKTVLGINWTELKNPTSK
jgi:GT2 family glycosyltransferase